jgi:glycosyl transferase family 87
MTVSLPRAELLRRPSSTAARRSAMGADTIRLIALGVGVFAWFVLWRARAINGDAVVYAETILGRQFGLRSIHIGYYLVGWLAQTVLGPLGVRMDETLVLLSAAWGAVSVVAFWLVARELGAGRRFAWIATFILLFAGNVLDQGISAEIYSMQFGCILISYVLFLRGRPAWAGVWFGFAGLISPLTATCAGFFPWAAFRRRAWRDFAIATLIAATLFAAVVAFVWRDYFFGIRGLFSEGLRQDFGLRVAIYNAYALTKSFHVMVPLIAVGLWVARRRDRALLGLLGITTLFHLPAIVGMKEDGVFLLGLYPMLALVAAQAIEALAVRPAARVALAAYLALYALVGGWIWLEGLPRTYRDGILEFLRRTPSEATLVASWQHALAVRYYGAGLFASGRAPRLVMEHELDPAAWRKLLRQHAAVYVMEKYYPGRASAPFLDRNEEQRRYERSALLPRLRRLDPGFGAERQPVQPGGPVFYMVHPHELGQDGATLPRAPGVRAGGG